MENILGAIILVAVVVGLVLLVRRMRLTKTVTVHEDLMVDRTPEAAGPDVFAALGALTLAKVTYVDRDHARVSIKERPADFVARALMPAVNIIMRGRGALDLNVWIVPGNEGPLVRLVGTTEARVLEEVREAIRALG